MGYLAIILCLLDRYSQQTYHRRQAYHIFGIPFYKRFTYRSKHDDVTKWKHFPRYSPFVRGIHRSPVNSPHKCQWCKAFMFSLICAWTNGSVNNRDAGDLRRLFMRRSKKTSELLVTGLCEGNRPSPLSQHFPPNGEQPEHHELAHEL